MLGYRQMWLCLFFYASSRDLTSGSHGSTARTFACWVISQPNCLFSRRIKIQRYYITYSYSRSWFVSESLRIWTIKLYTRVYFLLNPPRSFRSLNDLYMIFIHHNQARMERKFDIFITFLKLISGRFSLTEMINTSKILRHLIQLGESQLLPLSRWQVLLTSLSPVMELSELGWNPCFMLWNSGIVKIEFGFHFLRFSIQ